MQHQVRIARVSMLYAAVPQSLIAQFGVAIIFAYFHSWYFDRGPLVIWFLLQIVILLGRVLLGIAFKRANWDADSPATWLWRFRVGVCMTGMIWGAGGFFFYSPDAVLSHNLTSLVMCGLASGALAVMGPDTVSFVLYSNLVVLPIALRSLGRGGAGQVAGLLMFILLVFLFRAASKLNASVLSSLSLHYENQALVERLERERSRLDNRLGRILNDSTNEIYVFDAASLRCLQVNLGAAQNLGYAPEALVGAGILDIVSGMDRSVFDALVQPLRDELEESISYSAYHRRKDGSTYAVETRLQLSTREDPPVFVATTLDITERKQYERALIHQANFDPLTDLPNREYMLSRLDSAFARARRERSKVALMFMDLDHFKIINDTMGHPAGDELLRQAADRIRSVLRGSDTPSRLSGDEFLVMVESLQRPDDAEVIARKLVSLFERPFSVDSREIYATVSIGICLFPDDGDTAELLLQFADTAMYQTKSNGRSDYRFFTQEMRAATEQKMAIDTHLRRALERDELSLLYQPKVDAFTGRILGAEALLRWNSPELGQVAPGLFIPVAEDLGLITGIGKWVLSAACAEAQSWQECAGQTMHVAVNVSPRQFRTGDLLATVDEVLQASGLPPAALQLEITESLLVQDVPELMGILTALRDRGIRLALDDFGTGYSSLGYLKRFPLQVLKIDRSFVRDLAIDSNDAALVEAIVAMAGSLNLDLVAEGVENLEQLDFLRRHRVRLVQGYLFSPPVSAETFRRMLGDGLPALSPDVGAAGIAICREAHPG